MTGRKCGKGGTAMAAACSEEGNPVSLTIKGSVRYCWLGTMPLLSLRGCCACEMECPSCDCDPRSFPVLDDTWNIGGAARAMGDREDMSANVGLNNGK